MTTSVNYVWMGNINNPERKEACEMGPKSLAQFDAQIPIKVWVQESSKNDIAELFKDYANIEVCSIDELFNRDDLSHIKPYIPQLKEAVEEMNERKLYSYMKDLVSIAVIAEFGGYFFDSTTEFLVKPDLPPIEDIKIYIKKQSLPFWDGQVPNTDEQWSELEKEWETENGSRALPIWHDTDVWTFGSSKAGHSLFVRTLNRTFSFAVQSISDEIKKWHCPITPGALTVELCNEYDPFLTLRELMTISWVGQNGESDNFKILPEIHLKKHFKGFFRRLVDNVETRLDMPTTTITPNSVKTKDEAQHNPGVVKVSDNSMFLKKDTKRSISPPLDSDKDKDKDNNLSVSPFKRT